MLHFLTIDLLPLKRWEGKLDANELLILSLIAKMDPRSERVRKLMIRGGYFMVTTRFIQNSLGIRGMARNTASRALKHLTVLGLVKMVTVFDKRQGKRFRYAKLTSAYWRAWDRSHELEEQPSHARANIAPKWTRPRTKLVQDDSRSSREGVDARAPSGAASPPVEDLPSFEERIEYLTGIRETIAALAANSKK